MCIEFFWYLVTGGQSWRRSTRTTISHIQIASSYQKVYLNYTTNCIWHLQLLNTVPRHCCPLLVIEMGRMMCKVYICIPVADTISYMFRIKVTVRDCCMFKDLDFSLFEQTAALGDVVLMRYFWIVWCEKWTMKCLITKLLSYDILKQHKMRDNCCFVFNFTLYQAYF